MRGANVDVPPRPRPSNPEAVQEVIGAALGDPTTKIALWVPDRAGYVDVHGTPLELPRDTRSVTCLTQNDRPVAALIHDPSLGTDTAVDERLVETVLMLLEGLQLAAELRESRSRIVKAALGERRRLQDDLHDGAQARLVAMQMRLQIARGLANSEGLSEELDALERDAMAAVEELRALARGIYPAALRDLGPATALRDLARRVSVPIQIVDRGIGRAPDAIEATIYFCIRDAIRHTIEHADADAKVTVTLGCSRDAFEFTITDTGADGPDAADAFEGRIREMRDLVEAMGGKLETRSGPRGKGASIRGTIPGDGA